jgi:hypothetical protein
VAEIDLSVAERQLGVGDRPLLVGEPEPLLEAERAAEPVDRGGRIPRRAGTA